MDVLIEFRVVHVDRGIPRARSDVQVDRTLAFDHPEGFEEETLRSEGTGIGRAAETAPDRYQVPPKIRTKALLNPRHEGDVEPPSPDDRWRHPQGLGDLLFRATVRRIRPNVPELLLLTLEEFRGRGHRRRRQRAPPRGPSGTSTCRSHEACSCGGRAG